MRDDGNLIQDGNRGGGKKWLDFEFIYFQGKVRIREWTIRGRDEPEMIVNVISIFNDQKLSRFIIKMLITLS